MNQETGAAKGGLYDPAVALEFFSSAGKPESIKQGQTIFAENEKSNRLLLQRDKMYFLMEGEVTLAAGGKPVGSVRKGEIFGEMASISQAPRSATAVARFPCRVIALDDKQVQNALKKKPEFALMLMSIMIGRLRQAQAAKPDSGPASVRESRVFSKSMLSDLSNALGSEALVRYDKDKIIMMEGQVGVLMFVVLEGRVGIYVHDKLVEKVGPGGVFGEMALVERAPRLASAVAETACSLLGLNRLVLLNLIKSSPEFGVSLLSAVAERARSAAAR